MLPTFFLLGLNEGVAVPHQQRTPETRPQLPALLEEDTRIVAGVGVTTVRGHTASFPGGSFQAIQAGGTAQADVDLWVHALQAAHIDPIVMLSPWPGNATAKFTDHYLPDDLPAYAAYVRDMVERYDGDGVADMPGLLAPVRNFEVDNEPDLKNSMRPRDDDGTLAVPENFCTPKEYAQVLVASSIAIHAASGEAKVLNGGFYRPGAPVGRAYMDALFAIGGVKEAIDVVSLHTYAQDGGETLERAIGSARAAAPGKPVWITETSVAADGDEVGQAHRMVAIVARAAMAGASRLYWHTLIDPPTWMTKRRGFTTNSLFRANGLGKPLTEKPIAGVFRALNGHLAQDDLTGAGADGAGAAKLTSGAVLLFDGTRVAPHGGESLETGAKIESGGTATAPAWLLP